MAAPDTVSPLREGGIYRFRGQEYAAVYLSRPGAPWRATALVCWPPEHGPYDIIYLRHGDRVLLGVKDFAPIGTIADLEDTGQTETEA
jgi:hypothetical protein